MFRDAKKSFARGCIAKIVVLAILLLFFFPQRLLSQTDVIRLVGSSTVFPFASVIAEQLSWKGYDSIVVESTGTGTGFKLFCEPGSKIQIAMASRLIKKSEANRCDSAGHKVSKFAIGYDGIVIVSGRKYFSPLALSSKMLFLAIAKKVPSKVDPDIWVNNYYYKWSDVDARLPNKRITIFGPSITSGTRDGFVQMVMKKAVVELMSKGENTDSRRIEGLAQQFRGDGHYITMGEQDNILIQKVKKTNSMGIVGYSYFAENANSLVMHSVNGYQLNEASIEQKTYPLLRELYLYVKRSSVSSQKLLKKFIGAFYDDQEMGEYSYLVSIGLVPLEAGQINRYRLLLLGQLGAMD